MQRGTIVQYNSQDGLGRIVCNGRTLRFSIDQWRGNTAPAVNRRVAVELDARGDSIVSVAEAPESFRFWESIARNPDEIATDPEHPWEKDLRIWNYMLRTIGLITLIAQLVYILAIFILPAATLRLPFFEGSASLWEIVPTPLVRTPGPIAWCLYLSCLVVLFPALIRKRAAWIPMLLPLALVSFVSCQVSSSIRELAGTSAAAGTPQITSTAFHLELGAYLLAAAAIVMAVQSMRKLFVHR